MWKVFSFAAVAVVLAGLTFTTPAQAQHINYFGQPVNSFGNPVLPSYYYATVYPTYPFIAPYRPYVYYGSPIYGSPFYGYNSPAANYYYYSYWYAPYNLTPYPYPPYYTRGYPYVY